MTTTQSASNLMSGRHHARHIRGDVPYHIISRVFQGRHLLRPGPDINRIIVGTIGRARELFPGIQLFALAFLSNHIHLMVRGPTDEVPSFVGFIKREISRRWGNHRTIGWQGTMWEGYKCTALPTPESQLHCLRYILSQGVKEGLVAKPQHWPGVHCARYLLTGQSLRGDWFNGTNYTKAVDTQTRAKYPQAIKKNEFYTPYEVVLDPIDAWTDISIAERRDRIGAMVEAIEHEGSELRGGKPPLGAKNICAVPLDRATTLPSVPWLRRRRTMICWSDSRQQQTKDYVRAYWEFQRAFRLAADAYLRGQQEPPFPPGAFRPVVLEYPTPRD